MQIRIKAALMRGGTSKGLYLHAADLPADPELRDRVLLAAMGSPDMRQIDGVGGGDTLTSKVAIVARSTRPDVDLDYLFAQVSTDRPHVDYGPSCGNILAGVAPFAIETGLIEARERHTKVRIRMVNTDALVTAELATPDGEVHYGGDHAIDGVPGTAAPIRLGFTDFAGTKTGRVLPSGRVVDRIDGIDITCIDAGVAAVLIDARALGLEGGETPATLNANQKLLARIEHIRLQAGFLMGLGDVAGKVLPKVMLLSPPRQGGTIRSRYFVPHRCHAAHAVTGAIALAAAVAIEGSIAQAITRTGPRLDDTRLQIEHPSGMLSVHVDAADGIARRVSTIRTARCLFAGRVMVPVTAMEDGAFSASALRGWPAARRAEDILHGRA